MLKISDAQLQALEASMDVAGPVASWLKETRPKPFSLIPAPQLAHMSQTLCRRAAALGIRGSKATFLFAGLAADLAADWDRHPAVQKALAKGDPDQVLPTLPHSLDAAVWEDVRAMGSGIGWRLDAPIWGEAAQVRVAVAVAATLAAAGLKPRMAPLDSASQAAREGGPCVQLEDGLFACAVFAALEPDGARRQAILKASLARTQDIRATIAAVRLRLLLEHEVWV
jgi:hypothetical protein